MLVLCVYLKHNIAYNLDDQMSRKQGSSDCMSFEGSLPSVYSLGVRKSTLFCYSQDLNFAEALQLQSKMDESLVIPLMLFHVLKKMSKSSFLLCSQLLALQTASDSQLPLALPLGLYFKHASMSISNVSFPGFSFP